LDSVVQFKVSDFGFKVQDSSNFEISALLLSTPFLFEVSLIYIVRTNGSS
jgi:hypothetical protein